MQSHLRKALQANFSFKTSYRGSWLLSGWLGMVLVQEDIVDVKQAPDETYAGKVWEAWSDQQQCVLALGKQYQTVGEGRSILLQQFMFADSGVVYLQAKLLKYIPAAKSFRYCPDIHAVQVLDKDDAIVAMFAEFVPAVPIQEVEE